MREKIICISYELNNLKSDFFKIIKQKKYIVLQKNPNLQISRLNKNHEIHIYDISKNTKNIKIKNIYNVNNHVNKTGINPLRGQQKNKINFYDITQIYKQSKEGKIIECFGKNKIILSRENTISAMFLCNYAICAHIAGFRKIYGYVVG